LVTVNALRTAAQIRIYLFMVLVFFLVYPFRGAITNYLIGYTVFGRAIWNYTYQNPNDLASLTLIALGIALAFAFEPVSTGLRKIAFSCSALGLTVLVMLTQSRGGFIGLGLGLGLPLIRAAWTRRGGLLLAIVVAVSASSLLPDKVWERLAGIAKLGSAQTIVEADPEGSAEQRFEIAKIAIDLTISSPIFGQGLDSFPYALFEYSHDLGHRDTHNTYLNLSAEIGIPGLIAWLTCVISALRAMHLKRLRATRTELGFQPNWIAYSIVGFLVAGFFGSYSRLNLLYVMLAVCWSIGQLAANDKATESRAQIRLRQLQQ
jgi:O-antigen ligase